MLVTKPIGRVAICGGDGNALRIRFLDNFEAVAPLIRSVGILGKCERAASATFPGNFSKQLYFLLRRPLLRTGNIPHYTRGDSLEDTLVNFLHRLTDGQQFCLLRKGARDWLPQY